MTAIESTFTRVRGAAGGLTWRKRELLIYLAVIFFLAVVAYFPNLFAPHDPYKLVGAPFTAPGLEFWFGTDEIGRDLFSRIVHGLQISVFASALAVAVGFVLGLVIGIPSGLRRDGWLDRGLTVVTESTIAIPSVLLTLAVITTFGRGTLVAAIAIGIGEAPGFARLIRGTVIRASTFTFVEAARVGGARFPRIVLFHIIPSVFPLVLSFTALQFGIAMLAIGSISYIGFGEAPPSPEWGVLIASGQKYLAHSWWVAIVPGLVLSAVVILLNRVAYLLHEDNA